MKRITTDEILNGSINKVIFGLSIPLMINSLLYTLYNLVDGIYLAQISPVQFAATSLVWPVIFLFMSIGDGLCSAGISLISQSIGSNNNKRANSIAVHLIFLCVISGVTISSLGYLLSPFIVKFMGGSSAELIDYSTKYLSVIFIGFILNFLNYGFSSIITSEGNTTLITFISAIGVIVNIILDPIFIFKKIPFIGINGFDLGVYGAAIATVISTFVTLFFNFLAVKTRTNHIRLKFRNFRYDKAITKELLNIGTPTAVASSGSSLGFTILQGLIAHYGVATLSAFSMVNRLTDLFNIPTFGIAQSLTAIVGQNTGAGNRKRIIAFIKKAILFILVFSGVAMIFVKVFESQLLSIYIHSDKSKDVYDSALSYINYSIVMMPLMGLFNMFLGFFQGSGVTKYGMYMSLTRLWIIRIPLIAIFSYLNILGSTGVWISMLVSNLIVDIVALLLFKYGNWDRKLKKFEDSEVS